LPILHTFPVHEISAAFHDHLENRPSGDKIIAWQLVREACIHNKGGNKDSIITTMSKGSRGGKLIANIQAILKTSNRTMMEHVIETEIETWKQLYSLHLTYTIPK